MPLCASPMSSTVITWTALLSFVVGCMSCTYDPTRCREGRACPVPVGSYSEQVEPLVRGVVASLKDDGDERSKGEALGTTENPFPGTKGVDDFMLAYKRAAPATVLVRTSSGHGSGIILTTDGKILTNAHVVDGATQKDFKLMVLVRLGTFDQDQGRMHLVERDYQAYVYQIDASIDLALIKLVDPPPDLVTMPLSSADPRPGQRAAAIGHAALGLLWAIKTGTVSAIGSIAEQNAELAGVECGQVPVDTPSEFCDVSAEWLASNRARYQGFHSGVVIQSDCAISAGDSGGPLLDLDGSLLGVNSFVRKGDFGEVYYHVGLDTVKSFVDRIPTSPLSAAPDPGLMGPSVSLADLDRDGVAETLASRDLVGAVSIRVDLDQNSFGPDERLSLRKILEDGRFEAEVVIVRAGSMFALFHDQDDDGRLETLLYPERDESGVMRFAVYERLDDQEWSRKGITTTERWRSGDFVPDAQRERFKQVLVR